MNATVDDLVGLIEADVGNGRVSVGAPVGRALSGCRPGETVTVDTPRGTVQLEIVSVRSGARSAAISSPREAAA